MCGGESRRRRDEGGDGRARIETLDELFEYEHAAGDGRVEGGGQPGRGTAGDQDAQVREVTPGDSGDDDRGGPAHLDRRPLAAEGHAAADRQQPADVLDGQDPESVRSDTAVGDSLDARASA